MRKLSIFLWSLFFSTCASAAFQQPNSADGLVAMEAEHFHVQKAEGQKYGWSVVSSANYAGGQAIQALPEDSVRYEYTSLTNSARADYQIQFATAGTYYVWVRGMGPNGSSDSLHVGINGVVVSSGASLSDFQPWGSVKWASLQNGTTTRITLQVPSAGLHTFNLWMRESGTVADKIVLTRESAWVPSGNGPDETSEDTTSPPPPPPPAGGDPAFRQALSPDGVVTMEAEHYHGQSNLSPAYSWVSVTNAAYAGGVAMQALPEDTKRFEYTSAASSARMDFRVEFQQAGVYYVWVRGVGPNGSSDSVHVGLNGVANAAGATLSDFQPWGSLRWANMQNGTTKPILISVPAPGVHTVNVWMRESGTVIDRVLLTSEADYLPSGSGPDETPQSADTAVETQFLVKYEEPRMVVIEAENYFDTKTGQAGHAWQVIDDKTYVTHKPESVVSAEKALQVLPDTGNTYSVDVASTAAALSYKVKFPASGDYYIWVRGKSPSSSSNSVHVGIDGVLAPAGTAISDSSGSAYYAWFNVAAGTGSAARITVNSAGLHTVNVWMHEDGFRFDKLILTRNAAFVPKLLGPSQSEQGSYRDYPVAAGNTVLSWSFDEDPAYGIATDGVVKQTMTCSACPAKATGMIGGAYRFNGATGFDLVSNRVNVSSTTGFAVETLVKMDTLCTTAQGIAGSRSEASGFVWAIGCENSRVTARVADSAGNGAGGILRSSSPLDDGKWHHIALVRDGTLNETRLYVDGALQASQAQALGVFATDAPLTVGKAYPSTTTLRYFNGYLDGLTLTNRALRSDEVARQVKGLNSGLFKTYWGCETPVRIMPLGDSITAGSDGARTKLFGTYRTSLYDTLTGTGYNVDFVGSTYSRHAADQDRNLEGWPGYVAYGIRNLVQDALAMNAPDLILLHIGTNDLSSATSVVSSALAGTSAVLNKMDMVSKTIPVVVARIINQKTYNSNVAQYNIDLAALVASRIANGDKLYLVDQEPVLNYATDMYDNLHPGITAASKMSTPWFNELLTMLPRCRAAPPIIVSPSEQFATSGNPWVFLPDVLGHPAGTFSLQNAPAGLKINPQSGEVRWNAPVAGTYDFSLQVVNGSGSDTRTFALTVQ
jgi:lysophospholipase L1-like esterase